jgi:molybdopterin converting factor small subunit
MPTVTFTQHLAKFTEVPEFTVEGNTVRSVLDEVFLKNPALRGYILEDDGSLRRHVAVFVDNRPITDRQGLSDAVAPASEIYVLQALSGGAGCS